MSRVAYVDGRYVPHRSAAVLVDKAPHLVRLAGSLSKLRVAPPMSDAASKIVTYEVIRRNAVRDGIVYLQLTRGIAPRDHAFPKSVNPVLVVTSRRKRTRRSADCR